MTKMFSVPVPGQTVQVPPVHLPETTVSVPIDVLLAALPQIPTGYLTSHLEARGYYVERRARDT